MKRYIALLRGINVSGKNKIAMSELKKGVEELSFSDVVTYLNSGNIVFSSAINEKITLSSQIELMIKDKFELTIPVYIILQDDLKEVLRNSPEWWGNSNKDIYDNLIFMLTPLSYDGFYHEIGAPNIEYEQVYNYKEAIFWSFSRDNYQKTNWWSKTADKKVKDRITIRTANTVRKLINL